MENRPELPAGLRGAGLVIALPEVPLDDAIAPVEVLLQEGVEWFSTPVGGELGQRLPEIFDSRIRLGVHGLRAMEEAKSVAGVAFAMTNSDPRCWVALAEAGVPAVAGAMTAREISEAWAAGVGAVQVIGDCKDRDIVGYGRDGALDGHNTEGMNQHRRWLAENTNPRHVTGSLKEGLVGADVFIGVSSGNLLQPEDLDVMADKPIVFAMANPIPEVDPVGTAGRVAVLATGRSDFPNQINNVLVFPGLFRGLLDTGLTDISMDLMRAAATGIAGVIAEAELSPVYIIPGAFDTRVAGAVAQAVRQFANT